MCNQCNCEIKKELKELRGRVNNIERDAENGCACSSCYHHKNPHRGECFCTIRRKHTSGTECDSYVYDGPRKTVGGASFYKGKPPPAEDQIFSGDDFKEAAKVLMKWGVIDQEEPPHSIDPEMNKPATETGGRTGENWYVNFKINEVIERVNEIQDELDSWRDGGCATESADKVCGCKDRKECALVRPPGFGASYWLLRNGESRDSSKYAIIKYCPFCGGLLPYE